MTNKTKKNTAWKILLLSISVAVVVMLAFVVRDWWLERRAHFVRYPEFGIDIPVNYTIHGIDVSKYQDIIDWPSVKDMKVGNVRMSFVFVKATEAWVTRTPISSETGKGQGMPALPEAPITSFWQQRMERHKPKTSSIPSNYSRATCPRYSTSSRRMVSPRRSFANGQKTSSKRSRTTTTSCPSSTPTSTFTRTI